jgi:hypothetical protein
LEKCGPLILEIVAVSSTPFQIPEGVRLQEPEIALPGPE